MIDIDYVVWDFDGVINNNMVDGRFIWADNFGNDLGIDLQEFTNGIFNQNFKEVISGRTDLLEHVDHWLQSTDFDVSATEILEYWFAMDAHPDKEILALMDEIETLGKKSVIATNNEHRRALYIEREMGFSSRVETVFSSGRMRCMKPQDEFFQKVEQALEAAPSRLILIDDSKANVEAAAALGWHSHHYRAGAYPDLRASLGLAGD